MKKNNALIKYSSLILIIVLLISSFSIEAAPTYPNPTSNKYLNDYARVVDQKNSKQIIALGYELEKKTGAQAIIVTVDSLDGLPIEEYANGLFRKWGIGQASKDNGLLILVSIKEQSWRVEVGRGLEGRLPDALAYRVMTELAVERFKDSEYGRGLAEAYSVFCDEIATEYGITLTHSLHTLLPNQNLPLKQRSSSVPYFMIIGLVILDLLFNRGRFISFIGQMMFWSSLTSRNRRGGPKGPGGFGGGSSNGGGSSGKW